MPQAGSLAITPSGLAPQIYSFFVAAFDGIYYLYQKYRLTQPKEFMSA
jgi:hypothetical protein